VLGCDVRRVMDDGSSCLTVLSHEFEFPVQSLLLIGTTGRLRCLTVIAVVGHREREKGETRTEKEEGREEERREDEVAVLTRSIDSSRPPGPAWTRGGE
jgi:hypothetical protein